MRVLYKVRPYEKFVGSANRLYEVWVRRCQETLKTGGKKEHTHNIRQIIKDFDNLEFVRGLGQAKSWRGW